MLSFDITDRHIRIIRGTENHGKIKVSAASTIDVREGLIANGHIKDIPKMATIINDELKTKKMSDKEAVISISSNLIVFKELHVPKSKGAQLLTMVQNQMQHTMGIAEDYSISYTIAGEIEEDGVQAMKVLATACPFDVVDCFRKVFSMLGIALKSVVVSCNSITRIILSDLKSRAKMPMLLVQIDPNFVSLNLYEDNQLTFSRFASIDPVDYDNSPDYIFEAVNENIFRMFQFQKSRNSNNPIQNVVFYGDTTDYIRLTNALEQMDITTSQLTNPNTVGGYENFEFQEYANAIGAMFKSNKDYERINLLEVDAAAGRTNAGASYIFTLLLAAGLSVAAIAAVWLGFRVTLNEYNSNIKEIQEWLDSPEVAAELKAVDDTQGKIDKVNLYYTDLNYVYSVFETKPIINSDIYEKLKTCITGTRVTIDELKFNDGYIEVKGLTPAMNDASDYVQNVYDLDYFKNIVYTYYKLDEETNKWEFTVTMQMPQTYVETAIDTAPADTPAAAENTEGGAAE